MLWDPFLYHSSLLLLLMVLISKYVPLLMFLNSLSNTQEAAHSKWANLSEGPLVERASTKRCKLGSKSPLGSCFYQRAKYSKPSFNKNSTLLYID